MGLSTMEIIKKEIRRLTETPPTWLWGLLFIWGSLILAIYSESFLECIKAPIGSDFYKFYLSAKLLLNGESAYWMKDEIISNSNPTLKAIDLLLHPNLNPPFFNILITPFAIFDYSIAFSVWCILSVLCGVAGINFALRNKKNKEPPLALRIFLQLIFFSYYPSFSNFTYGQVGFFVFFILSLALFFCNSNNKIAGGILIGIAASIKLFCGIFIIMLIFSRSWKLLFYSIITFVFCFFLGAAFSETQDYYRYFRILRTIDWYGVNWNASYTGFFHRVLSSRYGYNWENAIDIFAQLANLLTGFAACYISFRLTSDVKKNNFSGLFSLAIPAMLIISPLGWSYYFPLLFLMLPRLIEKLKESEWKKIEFPTIIFLLGFSITFLRIGLVSFDGLGNEGWLMNLLFYGLFCITVAAILINHKQSKKINT